MRKFFLFILLAVCGIGFAMAQAQKVGVYVTGEVNAGNKKIVAQKMVSGLAANKELTVTDRTNNIISELAKDRNYKVNAPVNVEWVCEIARDMGLVYVAIADLTDAMGSLVISAQIVDAANGENMAIAEESVKINSANDLMRCVDRIAKQLLEGLDAKLHPVLVEDEPVEEPVVETVPEPEYAVEDVPQNNPISRAIDVEKAKKALMAAENERANEQEPVFQYPIVRIGVENLTDKHNEIPGQFKMFVRNSVISNITKTRGYQCFDVTTVEERPAVDRLLMLEANKMDDDNLSIAFKIVDVESLQVLHSGQVIGTIATPAVISNLLNKKISAALVR